MFSVLLLMLIGMALGPIAATGANKNLIGNAHLNAPVGDFKVKTASNVRAHHVVMFDTTAKEIKAATTAVIPLGWAAYRVKDGEIKTSADYAAGDVLKVERGPGTIRQAVLLSGSSAVNPGDPLTCAGNGKLKKAAALAVAVTVPAGGTAVTSDAAQPDLAESVTGGVVPEPIVAYAMEISDPSAADKTIAVMSAI